MWFILQSLAAAFIDFDRKSSKDKPCLSFYDSDLHFTNNDEKTVCGKSVDNGSTIVGEITYCSRCLLHD